MVPPTINSPAAQPTSHRIKKELTAFQKRSRYLPPTEGPKREPGKEKQRLYSHPARDFDANAVRGSFPTQLAGEFFH
jgi:hypothetical protein